MKHYNATPDGKSPKFGGGTPSKNVDSDEFIRVVEDFSTPER